MRKRSGSHKVRSRLGATEVERPRRDVEIERVMRADSADAFIRNPDDGEMNVDDDLAENLAEDYLQAATQGMEVEEDHDQIVPEEIGGPFVETTAAEEFAQGIDTRSSWE